jgi:hypothetical protein
MAGVGDFKALLRDLVLVLISIYILVPYSRFTFLPLDIEIFLNNPCLALNLFWLEGLSGLRPSYLRLSSSFRPWRLGDYRLYIISPVFLALYKVLSDPLFVFVLQQVYSPVIYSFLIFEL